MLKQSLPFGIISPANWGSLVIPMSEEMETNSNKSWQNCSVEAMRNKLRPVGSFWSRRNLYFQSHCTTLKMSLEIVSLQIHFAADFLLLRESREVGKFPLFEPTNLSIRKSFIIRKNKNYRRSLICLMSLSFWGEKSRPTLGGWRCMSGCASLVQIGFEVAPQLGISSISRGKRSLTIIHCQNWKPATHEQTRSFQ